MRLWRLYVQNVALWAVLLASGTAIAARAFDPELNWRTIKTERFSVHYPDDPPGARNLAIRVSNLAERELDGVCALFGNKIEKHIEIVLTDAWDSANGSAGTKPRPVILMRLAAPTELTGLSSYDDWLRLLLVHEIAHICDIDQTHGVTKALEYIFGAFYRWNGDTPHFFTEGVAVYVETLLSDTGRGRSSYVDMTLRTAALEGEFIDIDEANRFSTLR